jgi:hypothetical protein
MTTENKNNDSIKKVQEHCIDLPGETVQCWIGGGTDKLKVILRKHRDVIFDIHLGNGRTYTLEASESDFYSVRDKKLLSVARSSKMTFKDGERTHIWISRDFHGALLLKSEGQLVYKVNPSEWDTHQYGVDPKEKPAPIIVAVGADSAPAAATKKTTTQADQSVRSAASVTTPKAASAPVEDLSCPVVCVVDGKIAGMPADIAEYFKKGGGNSGLADIDPHQVATRNWIWGQAAGTAAYIKDNWEWLRASLDGKTKDGFKLVKARVHLVRGRVRFYFSGYSNSNTVFGRGGFGPGHDRIMTIFSGAGKTSSTFAAAAKGVAGTFKNAGLVCFIFGSATAIAEWKDDIQKDGYDLAATLITTIIKAILVTVLTSLVVAAIVAFFMIGMGINIPIIAVGVITVFVGLFFNYVVEALDKIIGRAATHDPNADGTAAIIATWIRKEAYSIRERLHANWRYLMRKMWGDYQEILF